jgi:hypothetical protein
MEPSTTQTAESDLFADPCPPRRSATDLALSGPGLTSASAGWVIAPRAGSRCTTWTYLANAAIHPTNLLVLMVAIFLCVTHLSGPVVLLGLAVEVAFVVTMQRCAFLRRTVHACLDEADRLEARRARVALVVQMGEGHRGELAKLEALVDKTLANARRRHGAILMGAGDSLGMARLTQCYIRLAVDHCAYAESLATTNLETLEAGICSLEAAATAQPPHARPILRRRLAIARRRAERWSQTRDSLETTGHQLAIIAELVYLLHQESLAPVSSARLSPELDRVLADFEHGEGARRELADLGIDDADMLDVQEAARRTSVPA